MRKISRIVLLLAGFASAGGATVSHAAQETVTFSVDGQNVVGTLDVPDNVKRPPVLLMLHGYTGNRNEWASPAVKEGLFGRGARVLAARGVASLRIDFRGSGESGGKFEDMTVDSEIKDALAALDFLAARQDVDSRSLSIVGMSLGGAVATAVAGRTTHRLSSVVLWNPGINLPAAFTSIYGEEVMKAGLNTGDHPLEVAMKGSTKTVALKSGFFTSLYTTVPAAEIEKYRGPLLLAVGTSDSIVFPQPTSAQALLQYHHGPHVLWTRPVDHGFGVEQSADTVDDLVEATGDFVLKYAHQGN
jgi:pimeloyl-ACP methyl ester carboxylesterase